MFRRWSIERKLTLIIVTATAVAMLAASVLLIGQHARSTRQQRMDDLYTLARILGDTSQAALSFADANDAAEVLGALRSKEDIRMAALYLADGKVLATYASALPPAALQPPSPGPEGITWAGEEASLFHRVVRNGELVGHLYLNADLRPWRRAIVRHIAWAVLIALGSMALASLLAARMQRVFLSRINQVVAVAYAVAAGDLPERLEVMSEDEIGTLQRSFNQIVDTMRDIVRQAQALARGNYAVTVQPRSKKDELALALAKMTEELRRYHEQSERMNWIKTALSELNDGMRGELSLLDLNQNIMRGLAVHVGAHVGALYIGEADGSLRRGAGYALEGSALPALLAPGEGLVGQAALDRRMRVIDLPDPALSVHTATVAAPVRQMALLPLVRENEVMGVLEFGTLQTFTPEHRELLQLAAAPIAIALHVGRARERVNELLVQTQRQSEALREQQAALQRSNAEMGERNALLEQQKQEIHRQNIALEEARLDLERKARELAQASQYKSEFLANVSHELRTPLNSLLILSQLLADNRDGNLSAKQVEFARTIHKSGSDLLALINDILDLSKVEAGRMDFTLEPVRLREVCAGVENVFRPLAEQKGLDFAAQVDTAVPATIRTDGRRVGQIVRNLLSNAFKFTSRGRVDLRVFLTSDSPRAVALAVHDTGIGVPADKQELVFVAFRQADGATSREYGGTGLGLTISRELARRLGGDLTLRSLPGQGSTFTLTLPLEADPAIVEIEPPDPPIALWSNAPPVVAGQRPADDRATLQPGARCILVVEDDPQFAMIVRDFVRSRNLPCLLAASGEEGLELASRHLPTGIVLDVMLPGLDGYTVLQRLKADVRTRAIPVFVISALDRDQQMLRDGAVGVLSKPVSPDELARALERLLAVAEPRVRRLLVVGDEPEQANSLVQQLSGSMIQVRTAASGAEALGMLRTESFDGMVLDLGSADMVESRLLDELNHVRGDRYLPVIVHAGRDLSREEEASLRRAAAGIVIKDSQSPGVLVDRVRLFLHLPPEPPRIASAPTLRRAAAGARGRLRGRKILVVDDDMRNAYSLAAVLDREGMACDLAADGRKALTQIEKNDSYAGILMDIMMPGMDGFSAIRAIRAQPRFQRIPIIALTANAMVGDREKCMEAGATDYLTKPVDVEKLLDLMERLMGDAA